MRISIGKLSEMQVAARGPDRSGNPFLGFGFAKHKKDWNG